MANRQTDVLIVGAGPAGAVAARHIAERGLDCLVMEKQVEVGGRLKCGGGLIMYGWPEARLDAGPFIRQRIRRVCGSYEDERYQAKMPVEGLVVDRGAFDRALAQVAVGAGVELWTGTRLTGLRREGDRWAARFDGKHTGELGAAVVIGADGTMGRVGRLVGLGTLPARDQYFTGVVWHLDGLAIENPSTWHYLFRQQIVGGYAWVFPHGRERANVGVCFEPGSNDGNPLDRLLANDEELIAILGTRSPRPTHKGGGNASSVGPRPPAELAGDGVVLIGDAAGWVDAINGEGLPFALASGRVAAGIVADGIAAGDTSRAALAGYVDRLQRTRLGEEAEVGAHLADRAAARRGFYETFGAAGSAADRQRLFVELIA